MARPLKLGLKGQPELEKRLGVLVRNIEDAVRQQTEDNANDLLGRAQDLSPQLEGDHIASGAVQAVGKLGFAVTFDEPYSVFLHEGHYNPGPVSSLKPPTEDGAVGREFLLRPFEKQKALYTKLAGKAVDDAVRATFR